MQAPLRDARPSKRHICLASFDEAAAADGSCPLEQIADASGIAVGGSVLQMTRDLSRVKVLMTHSKSLTPAQQNWPPLIQEAFAQLEVKRATRRTFGSIRTVCWTDHANLTRAQTSDIGLDPKLVRWVGEILLDGSEIRSLSGRSATLGDRFSRTGIGCWRRVPATSKVCRVVSEDSTWTSTLGRVLRARGRSPGRSVATPCTTPRTVLRSRCQLLLRRRPL